jgi:AraC family transcriptional activator of pobA
MGRGQHHDLVYDDLQGTGEGDGPPPAFFMWRLAGATFDDNEGGAAHRHNFQEIIHVEAGEGLHRIDGQPVPLRPGTVALIAKGQVHDFEYARGLTGHVLRFTDDALPPDHPGAGAGAGVGAGPEARAALFHPLRVGDPLRLGPADRDAVAALIGLIAAEHDAGRSAPGQDGALRHLLAALLIRLERLRRMQDGNAAPDGAAAYGVPGAVAATRRDGLVYRDFLALLEERFRERHDVATYAEALLLTPDQLSRGLAAASGRTAKQLIAERVALEARRLLRYTPLSVKEIADDLGYGDQFRFSRAFKAATGLSPQAFRDRHRKTP